MWIRGPECGGSLWLIRRPKRRNTSMRSNANRSAWQVTVKAPPRRSCLLNRSRGQLMWTLDSGKSQLLSTRIWARDFPGRAAARSFRPQQTARNLNGEASALACCRLNWKRGITTAWALTLRAFTTFAAPKARQSNPRASVSQRNKRITPRRSERQDRRSFFSWRSWRLGVKWIPDRLGCGSGLGQILQEGAE